MPIQGEALIKVGADTTGAINALTGLNRTIKDSILGANTLGTSTAGTAGRMASLGKTANDTIARMTGLNIAALGVAGGIALVGKTIIDSMRNVTAYNKAVLDASRATRMGVEDLSRFIQVGDDMGVSMDAITRSLQLATKNGFAPSIESLAGLADKANAMATPTERAAMLAKILGRNWAELNPILELGGDRIREMAAAQADGLVVTEAEIVATERYRIALDALNDKKQAFLNTVGTQFINGLMDETVAWQSAKAAMDSGKIALGGFMDYYAETVDALRKGREAMAGYSGEVGFLKNQIDALQSKEIDIIANVRYNDPGWSGNWAAPSSMPGINRGMTITEQARYQASQQERKDASQQAHGGALSRIAEVGEEGTEGIINGRVIPHNQWEQMKRAGVVATKRMRLGGDVENVTTYGTWPTTPINPDVYGGTGDIGSSTLGGMTAIGTLLGGGGGGDMAATIAATAQATASAAAEAAAVSVATAMPQAISQAVSQQTAQQVQIQIAGNAAQTNELRAIRRQLKNMNEMLPRAFRDTVANL